MSNIALPQVISRRKVDAPRIDSMLDLFLSMLDVRVRSTEATAPPDEFSKSILSEVKSGIASLKASPADHATAWNEAYRLERLLALVEPPELLKIELNRRLNDAAAANLRSVSRLKQDVDAAVSAAYDNSKQPPALIVPAGPPILRNTLNNLLEEIHWEDQRKFYMTPILKTAVRKIVLAGLLIFFIVILPLVWVYAVEAGGGHVNFQTWPWLPLYIAISTGAFGACFSRLAKILQDGDHMSIRELENAGKWSNLLLRGAVGMSGALILFFFLKSGLIEGHLFPDFKMMGLDVSDYPPDKKVDAGSMHGIEPSPALALLAIWSFIAGFSERLVPTILSSTEASFSNSVNLTSGK